MKRNQHSPQSASTQRRGSYRQGSPLGPKLNSYMDQVSPRGSAKRSSGSIELSQGAILASSYSKKEVILSHDKIPYGIYLEIRQDLDFTRERLTDSQARCEQLQDQVLTLTHDLMERQIYEKDLQALLTTDEIHKQIFIERDNANKKLEDIKQVLVEKEQELKSLNQTNKMLEWNIQEYDDEAK